MKSCCVRLSQRLSVEANGPSLGALLAALPGLPPANADNHDWLGILIGSRSHTSHCLLGDTAVRPHDTLVPEGVSSMKHARSLTSGIEMQTTIRIALPGKGLCSSQHRTIQSFIKVLGES